MAGAEDLLDALLLERERDADAAGLLAPEAPGEEAEEGQDPMLDPLDSDDRAQLELQPVVASVSGVSPTARPTSATNCSLARILARSGDGCHQW
jgi:hypothetical protein